MSSPSNVVVVITHVQLTAVDLSMMATDHYQKWVLSTGPMDPRESWRLRHTEQVIEAFFQHAITTKGLIDGAEGDCFSFAYSGNYVNIDTFIEAIEPFVRSLVERMVYTSATIFCQPHDMGFRMYKLDGAALESKNPNLKLRVQRKFEAIPMLSFDVDIRNIRTCDIREPKQGPPEPMTPEQAKAVEDLTKALEAGYGGVSLVGLAKEQVLTMESLEAPLAQVSFVYTGERRANCKLCKEGYGLKCAFNADGLFQADNHECGTMRALRTLADSTYYQYPPATLSWSGDQACAVIPAPDDRFIILGWYKQRGKVENAFWHDENRTGMLTRDEAEKVIEFYKNQKLQTI